MYDFDSSQERLRPPARFESQHQSCPAFDISVILLNQVFRILILPNGHDLLLRFAVLNDIARNAANTRKIEQHWDGLMRMAGSLTLGTIRVSVLNRSLLSSDRPSGLTQAIIVAGKINKTLYLLNYIDDEAYRRRILTQFNQVESRHAVASAICHGQKGEIKKSHQDGQEEQLGRWS